MRCTVVIGLWMISALVLSQQMSDVRKQFHAMDNEEALLAFIDLASATNDTKAIPYKEAAYMRMAKYTSNPFKKLKYFNEGKTELEAYVNQNPFDIEARYVRALVQSEVPDFLNYNDQLSSDVDYIQKNIDSTSLSSDYKNKIKQTISQLIKTP